MLVTVAELKTYMDISLSNRQTDAAEFVLEGLQSEMEAYLNRPIEVSQFVEDHVVPSNSRGVPANNYMYDRSLDTTLSDSYSMEAPVIISLRNSPVVSVEKVSLRNSFETPRNLAEAMKRTSVVTDASISGDEVEFDSVNEFTVGQWVTVKGLVPSTLNCVNKQIYSVTETSFVVKKGDLSGSFVSGGEAEARGGDYKIFPYGLEFYSLQPNDLITIEYTGGLDGEQIKVFKLMILRAATREMQNMHDDTVGVKDLTTRGVAALETGFSERELFAVKSYKRRRIT